MYKLKDNLTRDIFEGNPKKGLTGSIVKAAKEKIFRVMAARDLRDLKIPPSNCLEKLKGDREGQYSIRVNEKYRICFNWEDNGAYNIEFTNYHK